MSSLNSLVASSLKDKENMHPNHPTKATHSFSPKLKPSRDPTPSPCSRPSLICSLSRNNYSTQQSIKTIIRNFCPTQDNSRAEQSLFMEMVKKLAGCELSLREAIRYCEQERLFWKSDIGSLINEGGSLDNDSRGEILNDKKMLCSDLGCLKVQELCECFADQQVFLPEHEKIISLLFPISIPEELSPLLIWKAYEDLKEECLAEDGQKNALRMRWQQIQRKKITPILWKDHARLQIAERIRVRTDKGRISYEAIAKIFSGHLEPQEINILFRLLLSLETSAQMPILDRSRKANASLLCTLIFKAAKSKKDSNQLQKKSSRYIIEEQQSKIDDLESERLRLMRVASENKKERDLLASQVELLRIQKEECLQVMKRSMEARMESWRRQYEAKIEELQRTNKQQKQRSEWYRGELQGLMKAVNNGNFFVAASLSDR